MKNLSAKIAVIIISLINLMACTRVITTDYHVEPVLDRCGNQIGEHVEVQRSMHYVADF